MAKGKDWNDKSLENKEEAKKEFENAEHDLEIDNLEFLFPDLKKNVDKLSLLNKDHIFINAVGGKSMITHFVWSEVTEREELEFITLDTFKSMYANEAMPSHRHKDSNITLGQWWIEHPKRRTLKGVVFDPSKPEEWNGYLNLWKGFGVTPKKGSWRHTKKHIWKILSNGNAEKFKYFIKWLAWTVQNPHERAEVAVIFTGKKGAGKGFMFNQFVIIFGKHGMSVSDKSRFAGRFTAHFRSLSFLFADEVYHPREREIEGRINAMITEPFIDTESKNLNAVAARNRLHIAMATNNEMVISAGNDERRYYINKVSDVYTRGKAERIVIKRYFDRIWKEMDNGGREAMLFDLLNYNLKGWHPRQDIPQTEELNKQRKLSLSALDNAIKTLFEDGVFKGDNVEDVFKINATNLRETLEEIEPSVERFSSSKIADAIKELGAERKRWGSKGSMWNFPRLKICRKNWDEKYGKNDWDDLDEWQVKKSPY